ncbi:MAG: DUF429 domain-containing protein [Burkholderiales bacterium]
MNCLPPAHLYPPGQTLLFGVDFTSAPRKAKPITVAMACAPGANDQPLVLTELLRFESFEAWADWLKTPGPWVGGFDLPFGLPRAFVEHLGWMAAPGPFSEPCVSASPSPSVWDRITARLAALSRAELIAACRAWCDARPAGQKFAHRATDLTAGSSSSMKWVNPPVALMLHAGAPRLMQAGMTLPMRQGDPLRLALEAYPGLLARRVLGRTSYKSDEPARRHCPDRKAARARLIDALSTGLAGSLQNAEPACVMGAPAGLLAQGLPPTAPIAFGPWAEACLDDPGADLLDAVMCLAQAHQAWAARDQGWAMPAPIDPIEGWIIGAPSGSVA